MSIKSEKDFKGLSKTGRVVSLTLHEIKKRIQIGKIVETEVRRHGFTVLHELSGHGVGRAIHEEPVVPNYYDRRANKRLTAGLVIAIEPIISSGSGRVVVDSDGWTIKTADGSISAHYEHTVVITRGHPILLTAA